MEKIWKIRLTFRRAIVLSLALIASSVFANSVCAQSKTALSSIGAMYPRVLRLQHNSNTSKNGQILASVFENPKGVGEVDIYSSQNGSTFTQLSAIHDPDFAGGHCCGTLYELPSQVGTLRAGTLLWAGSVGQKSTTQPMQLKVYQSADGGATWSYLSNCATTTTMGSSGGGLWEPQFEIASDGALVCFYSDETQAGHSQLLAQVRSHDGIHWQNYTYTVASAVSADRPGMAVVTKLPSGLYFMTYEICGTKACTVYERTSSDGWNWGDPADLGAVVQTASGQTLEHAPTNAWAPSVTSSNGTILVVGEMMYDTPTAISAGNGITIFTNHSADGSGTWETMPAPVLVPDAQNNPCTNYSSSLLPSVDGTSVLEFASDYVGTVCTVFFNTGPILAGTATPTVTVTAGATRFTGFPLQVNVVVNGLSAGPVPVGKVTLSSGSYSATVSLSGGEATFSVPGPLPTGQNTLTAAYSGDSNYTAASGSITVDLVVPPVVTVTPASSTIAVGQAVNVGVAVSSQSGGATPTGTVILSSGGYSSSSTPLSKGGATLTVPANSLAIGTAEFEAAYSGDTNYAAQSGNASITVTPNPGFTMTGTPVSVVAGVASGNSSTVTLTSIGGFAGSVSLTASISQWNGGSAPAKKPPILTIQPSGPVSLGSNSTTTATLTVTTTGSSSAAARGPGRPSHSKESGGAVLACVLFFGLRRRRKGLYSLATMGCTLIAFACLTACGSGASTPPAVSTTTPGTYLVTVTGTSGSVSADTSITVSIQ